MAAKSDKKTSAPKKSGLQKDGETNKKITNSENQDKEDSIDFESDEKPAKSIKKSASTIKENNDNDVDFDEDGNTAEDTKEVEDDWDPDFDEFDLPKSSKKILPGKKSAKESEDEFKVDEEFEDFFNSSPKKKYDDDDDDY